MRERGDTCVHAFVHEWVFDSYLLSFNETSPFLEKTIICFQDFWFYFVTPFFCFFLSSRTTMNNNNKNSLNLNVNSNILFIHSCCWINILSNTNEKHPGGKKHKTKAKSFVFGLWWQEKNTTMSRHRPLLCFECCEPSADRILVFLNLFFWQSSLWLCSACNRSSTTCSLQQPISHFSQEKHILLLGEVDKHSVSERTLQSTAPQSKNKHSTNKTNKLKFF